VIRVYDSAGGVIETHEHAGEFKEPQIALESFLIAGRQMIRPGMSLKECARSTVPVPRP
jgi:hypothetical protein